MNLIERIRARFAERENKIDAVALLPRDVNRATRRRFGFRGPVDPKWVQHEATVFVPRYVRRHYSGYRPVTRRQRRHRAVIVRLMAAVGDQQRVR